MKFDIPNLKEIQIRSFEEFCGCLDTIQTNSGTYNSHRMSTVHSQSLLFNVCYVHRLRVESGKNVSEKSGSTSTSTLSFVVLSGLVTSTFFSPPISFMI